MNTSESLTLLTLIVSTFSPLFIPLFGLPLIGISKPVIHDINQTKIKDFSFVIGNYGLGNAANVKVSVSSPYSQFLNFSFQPYLSNHLKIDNNVSNQFNQNGQRFFEIDSIPPNLKLNITGFILASNNIARVSIVPTVFSNETVGINGLDQPILTYAIIGIPVSAIIILSITMWRLWYKGKDIKPINEIEEKIFRIEHDLKFSHLNDN